MPKKLSLLLLSLVALCTLVLAAPATATPPEPAGPALAASATDPLTDITDTLRGQAERTTAAERFRRDLGAQVSSDDLRVYTVNGNAEDILVAPRFSAELHAATSFLPDGMVVLSAAASTEARGNRPSSPSAPREAVVEAATLIAPYWDWAANYCFARKNNTYGYIDACYYLNKLQNDADPNNDFYSFYHYATTGPMSGSGGGIWEAWLESVQNWNSSPMSWVDWSPKSDTTGGCSSMTISITVFGVGISANQTRCETWDITKGAAGGSFKNKWSGGGIFADREIAYISGVSVPQGGWPVWYMNWGVKACYGFGAFCQTSN